MTLSNFTRTPVSLSPSHPLAHWGLTREKHRHRPSSALHEPLSSQHHSPILSPYLFLSCISALISHAFCLSPRSHLARSDSRTVPAHTRTVFLSVFLFFSAIVHRRKRQPACRALTMLGSVTVTAIELPVRFDSSSTCLPHARSPAASSNLATRGQRQLHFSRRGEDSAEAKHDRGGGGRC